MMIIDPYRFGGGGDLWTPAQITTRLWYDAADADTITSSGSDLTAWNDKSGNGDDLSTSTGSEPQTGTRTLNGLNVVDFIDGGAGSGDRAIANFTTIAQPILHIILSKIDVQQVAVLFDSYNNTIHAFYKKNVSDLNFYAGVASPVFTDNPTTPIFYSLLIDNTSTARGVNGTYPRGLITAGPNGLDGISLGNIRGNPSPIVTNQEFDGYHAEYIALTGANITTANRQLCEGYLAWKWGLEANLPIGHPYKSAAPTI